MFSLLSCILTAYDLVTVFNVQSKSTGKKLFELVTKTIGVRETWYFGLSFTDTKKYQTWLRMDKKV